MSLEERTLADGEYNTTMTIITAEPGGLTKDHSNKMRMLVVSIYTLIDNMQSIRDLWVYLKQLCIADIPQQKQL